MSPNNQTLDVTTLETWLWEAACKIRGPVDAPKFKDYILPLVFLKRLSDVFDDEVARLGDEFGSRATAERLVEDDHDLVRFYLPPAARWSHLAKLTIGLGEALTDAVRAVSRENPKLASVIDAVDFNATQAGQRMVGDDRLRELVQVLGQHRLGLRDVEPDILGGKKSAPPRLCDSALKASGINAETLRGREAEKSIEISAPPHLCDSALRTSGINAETQRNP